MFTGQVQSGADRLVRRATPSQLKVKNVASHSYAAHHVAYVSDSGGESHSSKISYEYIKNAALVVGLALVGGTTLGQARCQVSSPDESQILPSYKLIAAKPIFFIFGKIALLLSVFIIIVLEYKIPGIFLDFRK